MSDGPKEIWKDTPFNTPLIKSGYENPYNPEDLRALKSNPEKIVRVTEYSGFSEDRPFLNEYRQVMDTLRDHYGFTLPDIEIVNYPNKIKDRVKTYVITDRIHGQTLAKK